MHHLETLANMLKRRDCSIKADCLFPVFLDFFLSLSLSFLFIYISFLLSFIFVLSLILSLSLFPNKWGKKRKVEKISGEKKMEKIKL